LSTQVSLAVAAVCSQWGLSNLLASWPRAQHRSHV